MKTIQKIIVIALIGTAWMWLACGGQTERSILISNPTNLERQELVRIGFSDWLAAFGGDSVFRIVDRTTGDEIPYQVETLGSDTPQYILLDVSVPAGGSLRLTVESAAPAPVKARTYARYVPERFDDFAWENDVVAFRMYGKALEGRPDDAQGLDLWSKRTTDLVIDKWYEHGDYHTDHGEGLDYYSVGMTLGAGDIAPYSDDTVVFSKHYREYRILDNGPLRSTFELIYEPWEVNGRTVSVIKKISLDAGSQLNRVDVTYTVTNEGELPVAIGIARRPDPGTLLQEAGVFGYWEPEIGDNGITGVGILLSSGTFTEFSELSNQYLALTEATDGQPLTYYVGGAWNKAGRYTTAEAWFDYLREYRERLDAPLTITIE